MKNLIVIIAAALAVTASCHRPEEGRIVKVTTSDTTYNLVNNSARTLQVNMYTNINERDNETNVRFSCQVDPASVFKIPFALLDTSFSTYYFYDVHTPDQLYSNWGTYTYGYVLFSSGHSFNLSNLLMTKARYCFLHGSNESFTWKAIDRRYYDNTSVWASMGDNERYLRVTIGKNRRGAVTTKQIDGTLISVNITDAQADSNYYGYTRLTMTTNNFPSQYVFYNTAAVPQSSFNNLTSMDTLSLYDGSYYWIVVPQ